MALPRPEPGLVARYGYLWRYESEAGRETSKDRPACIVATVSRHVGGVEVVLLPITTRPPAATEPAIELPVRVKQHLGMDAKPAWVILTECNIDTWPTPDLAEIPGRPEVFAYGYLPPRLFGQIRDAFAETVRVRRARLVRR